MLFNTFSACQVTPGGARGRPTCTRFLGHSYAEHLLCDRDGGGRHVLGVPAMGCAFWQREPGADDA